MALDLVIHGGTVCDGTGQAPFAADIGVAGGRIAAIGVLDSRSPISEIAARGCIVAPGFIDIHSHSDLTLLVDPRAVSAISQGVTTEVIGNCGHGCAPIVDPGIASAAIYGPVDKVDFGWRSVAGYFARLAAGRPAVNVMALVPNGQLRLGAMAEVSRPARPEEVERMQYVLAEALEQGAIGLSSGLEYAQENGAPEHEIQALCRVVAKAGGGLYATHTRERDRHALGAVLEAIRTARATGVRLQISHIVPRSGRAVTEACLAAVDRAREQDADLAFDMHTRLFGFTHLKNLLPRWALAGDAAAIAGRLKDEAARRRMAEHPNLISMLGDWERVLLTRSDRFADLEGLSLAEIGRRWKCSALDAAYDVLLSHAADILRPMVILESYSEEVLCLAYQHPLCMIGSDATSLAPDGPLAQEVFHGAYGWAAWFWRRMVRERALLKPEEAVRRLTSLPAERLGLASRGRLTPGAAADIVVFDPGRFGETATVAQPNRLARGVAHVLVNGVPTLANGILTGERAGRILRRCEAS